ncbi:MAG: hypothetical protein AAGF45_11560 [Pseudomonadota bacterium]
MILVPDLSTVVILTPRTGSGSLRRAILAKYPNAMQIYRHMEADGVPAGYDTWRKVGVVRHPVERLWSLFNFLKTLDGPHDPAFIAAMRQSVRRDFSDWLLNNEVVFTSPYDRTTRGRFFPAYCVRHPVPENRKSQAMYIRPDLGTKWWPFSRVGDLARELGVVLDERHNQTNCHPVPLLTPDASDYVARVHAWDFRAYKGS